MEEIGNSLKQSMIEIFEEKSPLAKSRDSLKFQIKKGKEILKELTQEYDNKQKLSSKKILDFLKIFYEGTELKKQITRVEKRNDLELLASLYSVVSYRMDRLDQIKIELQELTDI